jgi:hypothetical protein
MLAKSKVKNNKILDKVIDYWKKNLMPPEFDHSKKYGELFKY